MTLLVGDEEDTIETIWPVLSAYASRYLHFGPIGTATAYKVMVNLMGAVQGAALAEGLALAERVGLDINVVADALASGSVASPHVKFMVERFMADDHKTPYFSVRWRHKNAFYGFRLAEQSGQPMLVSMSALDLYEKLIKHGKADKCESIIIEEFKNS